MEERMPGDRVDPRADEALPEEQPDEVFEADGDTTGADPRAPGAEFLGDDEEFDDTDLQSSTGGGMGPESYPPAEDEDYSGNGADRGPS